MDIKNTINKKVNLPWAKITKISVNVLVIFVFVFAFLMVLSKSGVGSLKILTVKSGSMSPALYTGSIIFVSPSDNYKMDDIITFRGQGEKEYITHRIVEADNSTDKSAYWTKGDANDATDSYKVPLIGVAGKVRLSIPIVGYILDFVKTVPGLIMLIVIPATIIIYEEIKKIKNEWKKIKRRKKEKDILAAENPQNENQLPQLSTKEKIFNSLTKHRKLFLFVVTIMSGLMLSHSVLAFTKTSGDLTITYPNEPLFNETNIAPGYLTSKIITVANNADEDKNVGVEFTSTSAAELDEVLIFSIQEDGTTIYGGSADPKTLADLVIAGEISLTTLSPGASSDFTIEAELKADVTNEYQGKISVFDLSVGFIEIESLPLSIPPVNIPPNTNGLVLGEEIVNKEPPLRGNILGMDIELPITGDQLLSYSLLLISITIVSAFSITKLLQKHNSRPKK